jgi:hypothetical protein
VGGFDSSANEDLRVLRQSRRILLQNAGAPLAVALYQAAGRGNRGSVARAMDRLQSVATRFCEADIFDLEERPGPGQTMLLGVFDKAIEDLEGLKPTVRS